MQERKRFHVMMEHDLQRPPSHVATTVTKMAYGKDTPTSDTYVKDARRSLEVFRVAVRPGAYLVDSIPWLKYIPWYGQELKREFKSSRRIYINQLNRVKEQLVRTTFPTYTDV
jgi:hypothetical protein